MAATVIGSHRSNHKVPTTRFDLLRPHCDSQVDKKQGRQKADHDRHARSRELHIGQQVMARNLRPGVSWVAGVIIERLGPVTYLIQVETSCGSSVCSWWPTMGYERFSLSGIWVEFCGESKADFYPLRNWASVIDIWNSHCSVIRKPRSLPSKRTACPEQIHVNSFLLLLFFVCGWLLLLLYIT